jgi:hypothetical protein
MLEAIQTGVAVAEDHLLNFSSLFLFPINNCLWTWVQIWMTLMRIFRGGNLIIYLSNLLQETECPDGLVLVVDSVSNILQQRNTSPKQFMCQIDLDI